MRAITSSSRWISARLDLVARQLRLPCPTPSSFAVGADHAMVAQCAADDTEVQRAAKRIFQHAGLPCDAVVVLWKGPHATIDRDGATWFLELPARDRGRGATVGATLARLAGRAALARRDHASERPVIADDLAELAALLLGLGGLLLHPEAPAGPLGPRLPHAYARIVRALAIPLAIALDLPLVSRGTKVALAARWLVAARGPLPFAALPGHVMVRCFCGKRLRVPTGGRGTSRCPACKRAQPFDGRACRAA